MKYNTKDNLIKSLRYKIKFYKLRYEMPSKDMLRNLSKGLVRETNKILKWMFDYHALRLLKHSTKLKPTI